MSTVTEQAEEVEREMRQRERLYPRWIEAGKIRADTAERKIATLRDAARTLRFVAQHAAGLRALAHFLIATGPGSDPTPTPDEQEALRAHPAIAPLLAVWPEAEVIIAPPAPAAEPTQPELFYEEQDA
jgi:hypothetical protein